jgi:hypothetical protein
VQQKQSGLSEQPQQLKQQQQQQSLVVQQDVYWVLTCTYLRLEGVLNSNSALTTSLPQFKPPIVPFPDL